MLELCIAGIASAQGACARYAISHISSPDAQLASSRWQASKLSYLCFSLRHQADATPRCAGSVPSSTLVEFENVDCRIKI